MSAVGPTVKKRKAGIIMLVLSPEFKIALVNPNSIPGQEPEQIYPSRSIIYLTTSPEDNMHNLQKDTHGKI